MATHQTPLRQTYLQSHAAASTVQQQTRYNLRDRTTSALSILSSTPQQTKSKASPARLTSSRRASSTLTHQQQQQQQQQLQSNMDNTGFPIGSTVTPLRASMQRSNTSMSPSAPPTPATAIATSGSGGRGGTRRRVSNLSNSRNAQQQQQQQQLTPQPELQIHMAQQTQSDPLSSSSPHSLDDTPQQHNQHQQHQQQQQQSEEQVHGFAVPRQRPQRGNVHSMRLRRMSANISNTSVLPSVPAPENTGTNSTESQSVRGSRAQSVCDANSQNAPEIYESISNETSQSTSSSGVSTVSSAEIMIGLSLSSEGQKQSNSSSIHSETPFNNSIRPAPQAFKSTGLISKRTRATTLTEDENAPTSIHRSSVPFSNSHVLAFSTAAIQRTRVPDTPAKPPPMRLFQPTLQNNNSVNVNNNSSSSSNNNNSSNINSGGGSSRIGQQQPPIMRLPVTNQNTPTVSNSISGGSPFGDDGHLNTWSPTASVATMRGAQLPMSSLANMNNSSTTSLNSNCGDGYSSPAPSGPPPQFMLGYANRKSVMRKHRPASLESLKIKKRPHILNRINTNESTDGYDPSSPLATPARLYNNSNNNNNNSTIAGSHIPFIGSPLGASVPLHLAPSFSGGIDDACSSPAMIARKLMIQNSNTNSNYTSDSPLASVRGSVSTANMRKRPTRRIIDSGASFNGSISDLDDVDHMLINHNSISNTSEGLSSKLNARRSGSVLGQLYQQQSARYNNASRSPLFGSTTPLHRAPSHGVSSSLAVDAGSGTLSPLSVPAPLFSIPAPLHQANIAAASPLHRYDYINRSGMQPDDQLPSLPADSPPPLPQAVQPSSSFYQQMPRSPTMSSDALNRVDDGSSMMMQITNDATTAAATVITTSAAVAAGVTAPGGSIWSHAPASPFGDSFSNPHQQHEHQQQQQQRQQQQHQREEEQDEIQHPASEAMSLDSSSPVRPSHNIDMEMSDTQPLIPTNTISAAAAASASALASASASVDSFGLPSVSTVSPALTPSHSFAHIDMLITNDNERKPAYVPVQSQRQLIKSVGVITPFAHFVDRDYFTMCNQHHQQQHMDTDGYGNCFAVTEEALRTLNSASNNSHQAAFSDYFESAFIVHATIAISDFSEVYHVQSRHDGQFYAIKKLKRPFGGPRERRRRLEEVEILWEVATHPQCIELIAAWEQNGLLFMQTALCSQGSLDQLLVEHGDMIQDDPEKMLTIMAQTAQAIQHVHSLDIVHLDVKPANVLVSVTEIPSAADNIHQPQLQKHPSALSPLSKALVPDDDDDCAMAVDSASIATASEDATPSGLSTVSIHLRLSDFGLAARLPIRQGAEYEGDRDYLAPEVLMYGRVSKAADIFSFGIMMFEILTDLNVPDCGDNYLLLRSGDLSWCDEFMQVLNSDNRVVAEIAEMARQMLLPDPEHRPTVGAIVQRCEALRHEL